MTVEKVLAAALRHKTVAVRLHRLLASPLVLANPYQRIIAKFLGEFVEEYRTLPGTGDWTTWGATLPEKERSPVMATLSVIQQQDLAGFTVEYLVDNAIEILRKAAAYNALSNLNQVGETITPDDLRRVADEVESLKVVGLEGLADIKDIDSWLKPPPSEEVIPSGIPALDNWIGGFGRKEQWFVMADSGIGKTTALINFGAHAVLHGYRGLQVTFELTTFHTIHRYYRRIAESEKQAVYTGSTKVRERLGKYFKMARGSMHVLYLEPYVHTAREIGDALDAYEDAIGEPLDMLILDYLDLLAPPKELSNRTSTYEALGVSTHQMRNEMVDREMTGLSATQATREAHGGIPTLKHMGDSYKKVQGADGVLGLGQTPDMAEVHQAAISVLKARESAGRGRIIPVYYNMDLMMISDLDHPNTRRIMRELGHSLSPEVPEDEAAADEGA